MDKKGALIVVIFSILLSSCSIFKKVKHSESHTAKHDSTSAVKQMVVFDSTALVKIVISEKLDTVITTRQDTTEAGFDISDTLEKYVETPDVIIRIKKSQDGRHIKTTVIQKPKQVHAYVNRIVTTGKEIHVHAKNETSTKTRVLSQATNKVTDLKKVNTGLPWWVYLAILLLAAGGIYVYKRS